MPKWSEHSSLGLFVCFIILLSGFSQVPMMYARIQFEFVSGISKYEVDSAFSGRLTHTVRVENPAFSRIIGGALFVPLLKNETNHHYVVICNITATQGQPKIMIDNSGNTYAYWAGLDIEPGNSFSVEVDYYLVSFGFRVRIDLNQIAAYDKSSDIYNEYTRPEELAQSDVSRIISQAVSLTKGISNIHEKVSRIYDFVTSSVQYIRQDQERGALWALQHRAGDCSEFSYLFVALCRAVGIPARVQTGFAFRSVNERIQDGHMWAEYFLQNWGWIPVDATWKSFDRIDDKHFYTMRSMPEITPYANYFFNYTQGPDEWAIRDSQEVLLTPSSMNLFGEELVSSTVKTVKTIKEARLPLAIEKLLGMPYVLRSEATEADSALLQSETSLQDALQLWIKDPASAQSYILSAQIRSEEAGQKAWRLVAYAFALFISVLIAVLLVASVLARRYQFRHRSQNPESENAV